MVRDNRHSITYCICTASWYGMNACSFFKSSYNQYSICFIINYIVIFSSMNWSNLTYKPFKLFANADKNIEMNFSLNFKSPILSFEPGFCQDNFWFVKDVGILWFAEDVGIPPPLPLEGVDFVIYEFLSYSFFCILSWKSIWAEAEISLDLPRTRTWNLLMTTWYRDDLLP